MSDHVVLDPDCIAGKHAICPGYPCECDCHTEREDDSRCGSCGAELGHYNGCMEDPDAMCLCHLCMGDQAVTSETGCPYHGEQEREAP